MGAPVQNGHPVQLGGVFDAIRSVLIKRPAVTFVAANPNKGRYSDCGFAELLLQGHQCGSAFMYRAAPTNRSGGRSKNFPVLQRWRFRPGRDEFAFRIESLNRIN